MMRPVADDWTTFLLRYGELGIKSPSVRRRFEQRLQANLRDAFKRRGTTALIDRVWGRFFLETPRPDVAREVIEHTFGLVHASPVVPTDASLDAIETTVRAFAPEVVSDGDSFAIRARRTGNHAFTSMDVAKRAGEVVLDEVPGASVDLDAPDVEVHVEVRDAEAYVFSEFIQAPGGLPLGSQGRVVVPFEGPRSPAAAWLVMRRGCSVHGVVPESCVDVVGLLEPWAPGLAFTVLGGEVSREGLLGAAEALVKKQGAGSLVLGEHESRVGAWAASVPVVRPLAGLPGKRWPQGAYALSKRAAELHPGPCVSSSGVGREEAVASLGETEVRAL